MFIVVKWNIDFNNNRLLNQAKIKTKESKDRTTNPINITMGEKVLLSVKNRKKLNSFYRGPDTVTDINNNNCVITAVILPVLQYTKTDSDYSNNINQNDNTANNNTNKQCKTINIYKQ